LSKSPKPPAVDLSCFSNAAFDPGRSFVVRVLWFLAGQTLLACSIQPSSAVRRALLRLFGAKIGEGAVIKPRVRVKFPWRLTVGKHCWLGEDCWIDNLAPVTLGDNVCLSQGTYLCTGNHDWADPAFGLVTRPIVIESGAWVAARAALGPGVTIGEHGIAAFGAVVMQDIPAYEIHVGNPARFDRRRKVTLKTVARGRRVEASERDDSYDVLDSTQRPGAAEVSPVRTI
jgi:putative colanic acid biosynthesis acetyltransferase WcaF